MSLLACVPDNYTSRYGLLATMARELREALAQAGATLIDKDLLGAHAAPTVLCWFNFFDSLDAIPRIALRPSSGIVLIQIMVDHPFAMAVDQMDRLAGLPHHRLCMSTSDGAHLLRLRWPRTKHTTLPHALGPEAVIDTNEITAPAWRERHFDVVASGHIHTQDEIDRMLAPMPDITRRIATEIAEMRLAQPMVTFESALDATLGARGHVTGHWPMMCAIWRAATAIENRRKRSALVRSLQGMKVGVAGTSAWQEFCQGSIQYIGEHHYTESPAIMRAGRCAVAWAPTQFTFGSSERLLLALGAGGVTLAERTLEAASVFGLDDTGPALWFDSAQPESLAESARVALSDEPAAWERARAGAAHVRENHLWSHRMERIAALAESAAPDRADQALTG